MESGKIVSIEDRIPKLKQQRRKKANKRLIFLLLLFFSLIVCVVYFQSPLSHIRNVKISGNLSYSKEEIIELTGLSNKINIWKVDERLVEGKLKKLPEIKSANVKVQFPNNVILNIGERKRIAYITKENKFLPVLDNGKILKGIEIKDLPVNAPILIGFSEGDALNELLEDLEELPNEVQNSISEIHYSPKDTDKYHIRLFMNEGYEVSASLRTFSEKMAHYPSIISQLNPEKKGVIDLEVGSYFKAYEAEETKKDENEGDGESER